MSSRSPILLGVTGSTAYGLAMEHSDIDRQGIFVAPTREVLSLKWNGHKETVVTHDPDMTMHEVGKFCRLALQCNPTVSEVLWLSEYEVCEPEAQLLISIREAFLSKRRVFDAYMGYAAQQAHKLQNREDDGLVGFGPKTKNRRPKHARHLRRLTEQCEGLLRTGELTIKVADRDALFEFVQQSTEYIVDWFENRRAELVGLMEDSPLTESPDLDRVDHMLHVIRRMND
jgi:predicted nucleotidyltransferase